MFILKNENIISQNGEEKDIMQEIKSMKKTREA